MAAFEAHGKTEHFAAWRAAVGPLLEIPNSAKRGGNLVGFARLAHA